MASLLDPNDGGMLSRKLLFAVGTSVLIFVAGVLVARFPALNLSYPTMIGGLIAVLSLYLGGNLGHTFILSKQGTSYDANPVSVDPPDPPNPPKVPPVPAQS